MESAFRKNTILLIGTVVVLFCFAEISIRTLDWYRGNGFISNNYRDQVERKISIYPYRIFGWDMYQEIAGVPYIASVHGELYPFTKPEHTFRIVAFGGSTTRQAVDGVHYPLRLQQFLQEQYPEKRIEVINVGNDAYATTHLITLLAFDVVSWNPDFIIFSENANDLSVGYFPRDYLPDYSNKYENEFYLPQYEARFTASNVLLHESSLYWFLKGKIGLLLSAKNNKETPRKSYGADPPRNTEQLFRRNVTTFLTIANTYKIPVVVATQPMNSDAAEVWDFILRGRSYTNVVVFPPFEEHRLHHHRFNEILKEVAAKEGAYILDNEAVFGGDPALFIDTVHYTKAGIEKLAEQYKDFFLREGILK
ncbi:MAG: hypothetical protein A3J54_02235 [Candidatus Ryanbacteria bacterium RIFCSPHIGHO2_02_FULL_45_13b]|uniref:Uncharacterized protein n=1 Tax=Candidatus Ryanbacteria bacterium RIFCSPHIGHO2_02_FULL_45_13b TaxID=1802117 RepID=A0A1G2GBW4_9BACT|nr:MAG: hypothetical protein A3J54_02235 [Candidatus Ryanbacteria bacterium RIFCSPHIGHO2_02_FULL_45_13b]